MERKVGSLTTDLALVFRRLILSHTLCKYPVNDREKGCPPSCIVDGSPRNLIFRLTTAVLEINKFQGNETLCNFLAPKTHFVMYIYRISAVTGLSKAQLGICEVIAEFGWNNEAVLRK
jgi:hypothetical protein